ncbi:hypothetical protein [Actinomyces faecalis]|uniref:hypothetical protein n=1 Tax=Actinomyces faecalis TaxID=2722820 RepID=UPI0015554B24|nr:hypothetical protein [Actinomyces faecalis]
MSDPAQQPLDTVGDIWDAQRVPTRTYTERASFTFHGLAVEGGTMRAAEFGQALIGYSKMVGEAARTISPKAGDVDVRVLSTERGSFITVLSVSVDLSHVQALWEWFGTPDAEAAARALDMVADGTEEATKLTLYIAGAVALCKRLRGRRIARREKVDKHHDRIIMEDGEDFLAVAKAVDVAENPTFRKAVKDFSAPITRPGIESVTLDAGEESETITPADRNWFSDEEADKDLVEVIPMRLQVERVAFDGGAWRFTDMAPSDGSAPYAFAAEIDDEAFLDDVAARRLRFAVGDELDAIVEVVYPRVPRRGARRHFRVRSVEKVYGSNVKASEGFLTPDGLDLRDEMLPPHTS